MGTHLTGHHVNHEAFQVINALPEKIAQLFQYTPNSILMTTGGVAHVMSLVEIIVVYDQVMI